MRIVRKLTWDLLLIKASSARLQARHNEALYVTLYAALRHILDLHSNTEDETGCRACDEDWPCSVARIAQGAINECLSSGAVSTIDEYLSDAQVEKMTAEVRRLLTEIGPENLR